MSKMAYSLLSGHRSLSLVAAAVALLLPLASASQAALYTWTGGGAANSWTDPLNWSSGNGGTTYPTGSDTASFGTATTVNFAAFNNSAFTGSVYLNPGSNITTSGTTTSTATNPFGAAAVHFDGGTWTAGVYGNSYGNAMFLDTSYTTNTIYTISNPSGLLTWTGLFTVVGGSRTFNISLNNINMTGGIVEDTLGTVLTIKGNNAFSETGVVKLDGGLVLQSGGITVSANNSVANNSPVLGAGDINGLGTGITLTGGTLYLGSNNENCIGQTGMAITVGAGNGTLYMNGSPTINNHPINLTGGNLVINAYYGSPVINSAITQVGSTARNVTFQFNPSANAFVTLGNSSNSWTGTTNITASNNGGKVNLAANNALPVSSVVNFTNGAQTGTTVLTVDMKGFNDAIRGLTSGANQGIVTNTSATTDSILTLQPLASDNYSFGGSIKDGTTNKVKLVLNGAAGATETLAPGASSSNTYSGGTEIDSGTLKMGGDNVLGTGPVNLVGGILNLNGHLLSNPLVGSGTISGGGTIAHLAPGHSAGLETITGTTALTGDYTWELTSLTDNPANAGVQPGWDLLTADGAATTLTLGGSLLFGPAMVPVTNDPFWTTNHTWTIVSATNGGSLAGALAFTDPGEAQGAFSLNTVDGAAGHVDVVWTAVPVPEPTTLALLAVGGLFGLAAKRRRSC